MNPQKCRLGQKLDLSKAGVWVVKAAVYGRLRSPSVLDRSLIHCPHELSLLPRPKEEKGSIYDGLHLSLCVCLCMRLYSGVCLCLCVCLTN